MNTTIVKCELAVFTASDFDPKTSDQLRRPEKGMPLEEYIETFPFANPYDEFEWYTACLKSGKIRVSCVEWI